MKHLVWVILGCLGLSVMTALAARFGVYHLVPDFAVVVTVFLALRREPVPMTLAVVPLGYFSGCCAFSDVSQSNTNRPSHVLGRFPVEHSWLLRFLERFLVERKQTVALFGTLPGRKTKLLRFLQRFPFGKM